MAAINPTQLTPPRVAFIDERSGAISREWYRFFLSLLTATQNNQDETFLAPDANSLLASYDAMLASVAQASETASDGMVTSLESSLINLQNAFSVTPPDLGGTVTSVAASGGATGLTFTGSPITTSGTLTLGGTLGVGYGGTGQTSYTNGQLLIGNSTGNTLTKATLTAGTNVTITNGAGSITINASDAFTGTVTSVSVVSANGLAGTVANATTTPAITLSTTVTGIVKGNGTALSAASAGTDYVAPGAITTSGLTMATARLLGRTTASTGAVEEISVAGGLTLSGGVLTGASGTVTSVTGTSPVVSSGGTTPAISMPAATASVNGYLTSTDWNTFNSKGSGSVTSVSGTGTVNGITLTGTVTTSGSLTLGGTLSNVSLTSQVTGTLPVGNGGTGTATAFTTGSVVFAGASGIYAQDNSNFFWDNTNKRLGIGTASPGGVLEIAKSTGAADMRLSVGGTLYGNVYASSSDTTITSITAIPLVFGTNSTTRFQVGSAGQWGIGGATYGTAGQVFTSGGALAAPTWTTPTTGTVTSVAALTLGTTGTDLSSTVVNSTTTPVITLNVPTASATNRGALSSTDWSTFNGKQAALVSGTNIKTVGGVSLLGSGDVGTIGAGYGGTGQSSYTIGDILYASGTTALSKLADVATGNALISGGVGVAPSWGKIGLTTHVSGTLAVGNGGTGATTLTSGYLVKGNGTSAVSASVIYDDGTNAIIGTTSASGKLTVQSSNGNVAYFDSTDTSGGLKGIYVRCIGSSGTATPVMALRQWRTSFAGGYDAGQIRFDGLTTSGGYTQFAGIYASASTNTASGAPTSLSFYTTTTAYATLEALRIGADGNLIAPTVYTTVVGATNRDVFVDNSGNIGYVSSILASKTNIADITDTAWLDALRPVSFNYRKRDEDGAYTDDAEAPLEYGLIAEEVEKINPELVFYDETEDGPELRGVSYSKLIIPLLKELQSLRARVAVLEGE